MDGQVDLLPHRNPRTSQVASSGSPLVDAATLPDETTDDLPFLDSLFDLTSDSVNFLDQVFMREYEVPEPGTTPPSPLADQVGTTGTEDAHNLTQGPLANITTQDGIDDHPRDLWRVRGVQPTVFLAALHAYFDSAALYLPILFEDAFWQDYNASRCSPALVFAIACRGMPFSEAEYKWRVQQKLARKFRKVFLEAQQTADAQGYSRLDELEALALMVDFEYDAERNPSFDSGLGYLYLTHDALVMGTLQARMHHHTSSTQAPQTCLARAEERRTLLFWHVYGLNAFHCLDLKIISRIQDDSVEVSRDLLVEKVGGYLDAILSLAMIARKISYTLCNMRVKQTGVRLDDVQSLYQNLHDWRNNACPLYLRWPSDIKREFGTVNSDGSRPRARASKVMQLQRAVVGFLELNCYMQIEDCVRHYGAQEQSTFEEEMLALRVGHETLRAVKDIVAFAKWVTKNEETGSFSVIDLAPQLLRDVCVGACMWIRLRLARGPRHGLTNVLLSSPNRETEDTDMQHTVKYRRAVTSLRNAVARAVSHEDTEGILALLDPSS